MLNVVVTGGGTIAPIDDVRQIANTSTGRLSAMIAEACLDRGAAVWHVHAPSALLPFDRLARFDLDAPDPAAECDRLADLRRRWMGVRERLHLVPLRMGTVGDYRATLRSVFEARPIDLAFLAIAVSDFEPDAAFAGKIETPDGPLSIRVRPTPKVIREVRDWAPGVYLVGFKLLSRAGPAELIAAAEAACRTNRADLTAANDLQAVREGRHTLHLVRPGHPAEAIGPGDDLAEQLVDRAFAWAAERDRREGDRPDVGP